MTEPEVVEETTIDGDFEGWTEPPPYEQPVTPGVQLSRTILRYIAVVVIGCGIGGLIVYVQNSGVLSMLSTESNLARSIPNVKKSAASARGVGQPGIYINKSGTFINPDGQHYERFNGPTPENTNVPTFITTPTKGYERVK